MSLVIDASILIDIFVPREKWRRELAVKLLRLAHGKPKYAPNMLLVELSGVISRYDVDLAMLAVDYVKRNMILIDEGAILSTCLDVAMRTGCRAADAYYIATAKLTNSVLFSNDKMQVENAKKAKVKAYYMVEEHDAIFEELNNP